MALRTYFDGTKPGQIITWSDPTVAQDVQAWTDIEIQVVGTPSVAYTPQRSLDGTNFVACKAWDKQNHTYVDTISAAGIYSLDGGGYVKLTGGSGSTFTIRAGR